MLDAIAKIDLIAFNFINHHLACRILDFTMILMSDRKLWIPIIFSGMIFLVVFGGKRGVLAAVAIIIAVSISDLTAAKFLKPLIGRLRPCLSLDVRLVLGCGGRFSFPSNHAANSAAIAMALFPFYKKSLRFTVPLAIAVGFSRIYLGVHYPSDVLGGFAIGAVIGYATSWVIKQIFAKNADHNRKNTVPRADFRTDNYKGEQGC